MLRRPLQVAIVAGLVILAGCAGELSGPSGTPATDATQDGNTVTDQMNDGSTTGTRAVTDGTVAFHPSLVSRETA